MYVCMYGCMYVCMFFVYFTYPNMSSSLSQCVICVIELVRMKVWLIVK